MYNGAAHRIFCNIDVYLPGLNVSWFN